MLDEGLSFPKFSLPDQDNKMVKLEDFKGKWLVVYVYPKDDTPGCTLEGRGFSALKSEYEKIGASVLGLSEDDVSSHKSFCDKYKFTIPLLADTQARLLKALGVGQTDYKGTLYWDRTTYLIDPQGMVRKIYKNVKPEGHEKAVLEDIKQLKEKSAA
jgi:peroxiredoxin Q/BCP